MFIFLISWLKNGLVLDLTEERVSARYTLFPSGGLEIREVRSSVAGTYRCQGTNHLFSTRISSNNALLTINPGKIINKDNSQDGALYRSPREGTFFAPIMTQFKL